VLPLVLHPVVLHKANELLLGMSGIVPKDAREANPNHGQSCGHHCWDHKQQ
jgi:hypothetical protein